MSSKAEIALFSELINTFKRGSKKSGAQAAQQLVKELTMKVEPLAHRGRMRQIVWLGMASGRRECADQQINAELMKVDGNVAASIKSCFDLMDSGDFFERYLALYSCFGSRDSARAVRGLGDKSSIIRRVATKIAPVVCEDSDMLELLETGSFERRQRLIHGLRHCRRIEVIDKFLSTIQDSSPDDFARLLPFAGDSMIEKEWSKAEGGWSDVEWGRLTRIHPEIGTAKLRGKTAGADCFDPRLLWIANSVLMALKRSKPEQSIEVIKDLLKHNAIQQIYTRGAMHANPGQFASLVLEQRENVHVDFSPLLHKLDESLVPELLRRQCVSSYDRERWLKNLSPSLRSRIFNEFGDAWRDNNGCIAVSLLRLLPRELREKEGRIHIALPSLSADPNLRLPYAQLLPWQEALQLVTEYLKNPDAALRGIAISSLVASVRFNRVNAGELLELLRARKNEQDPVRLTWLAGLSQLPPGIWKDEHLDGLNGVIKDALDAKDLSYSSIHAIDQFLVKLVPFHTAWAADWLASVMKDRAYASIYGITQAWNEGHVRTVARFLAPVLKSWQNREREPQLVQTARSFGKRLVAFEELTKIIQDVVFKGSTSSVRESALSLLYEHRRSTVDEMIAKLLQMDPTWSQVWIVSEHLHTKRQDLLTPYLGQNAFKGAFASGKVKVVPAYSGGFYRWSREQLTIYCRSLTNMTSGRERNTTDLFFALGRLASVPDAPADVCLKFARISDVNKMVVRDYAIQCLAKFDAGEGFQELVRCLSDDRARIAIYSLSKAIESVPADEALHTLKSVSREKVAVFKESIRLIGDLKTRPALQYLLDLDKEDLHRDVRIALLRSLWNYLETDAAWDVLSRATRSDDKPTAVYVTRTPSERLSPKAQEKLVALLSESLASDDPEVRIAVLSRCATMPILDKKGVLYAGMLSAAQSDIPDEYAMGTRAIVSTYATRNSDKIAETIQRLMDKRRNLAASVAQIINVCRVQSNRALPSVRAALQALEKDPYTGGLQMQLAASCLPWEEFITHMRDSARKGLLHAGTLAAVVFALESSTTRPDAQLLHVVEEALAGEEDEMLRRIGLAALVAMSGGNRGWTAERIERLKHFRKDSSLLVASSAQFIFPPGELVPAAV